MNDQFVEKASVAADVYLVDGTHHAGRVYVEPGMSLVGSMQGLLLDDRRLIPFRGESEELVFLGRRAVAALRFEFDGRVPPGLESAIRMRTTVVGGHVLEGVLHLPDTGGRISDMLDAAKAWMLMESDGWAVWIASDLVVKWEAP